MLAQCQLERTPERMLDDYKQAGRRSRGVGRELDPTTQLLGIRSDAHAHRADGLGETNQGKVEFVGIRIVSRLGNQIEAAERGVIEQPIARERHRPTGGDLHSLRSDGDRTGSSTSTREPEL